MGFSRTTLKVTHSELSTAFGSFNRGVTECVPALLPNPYALKKHVSNTVIIFFGCNSIRAKKFRTKSFGLTHSPIRTRSFSTRIYVSVYVDTLILPPKRSPSFIFSLKLSHRPIYTRLTSLSVKNLWRRKCAKRAIVRNVEVRIEGGFLCLQRVQLRHCATFQGSSCTPKMNIAFFIDSSI